MGLLNYITAHSLDEDYAHVSRRQHPDAEPGGPRPGAAAMIIVGIFGLLLATAAVQTSRNASAVEGGDDQLVTQVQARSAQVEALRDQITDMRAEIARLETRALETTGRGREMSARLSRLGVSTGAVAVRGPGVKVTVDDAPNATGPEQEVLDSDLQKLVNALWLSGAEAVSINGERLSNLSAIRHAGSAITVNFRSLRRPYVVSAVGDPNSMPARFVETRHGSQWLDYQRTYGLQFAMTSEETLRLPGADEFTLRHARTLERGR